MNSFIAGLELGLGGATAWLILQALRHTARPGRAAALAHPQPVCLIRHDHKGRQAAAYLSEHCEASAADLADACAAFADITRAAARRHGTHAVPVLLCDLDGARQELTALGRADVAGIGGGS